MQDGSVDIRMKPAWVWECPDCEQKNLQFLTPVEFTEQDKQRMSEQYPEMTFQTGRFVTNPDEVMCECGFMAEISGEMPHPLWDDLDESERWKYKEDDDAE